MMMKIYRYSSHLKFLLLLALSVAVSFNKAEDQCSHTMSDEEKPIQK